MPTKDGQNGAGLGGGDREALPAWTACRKVGEKKPCGWVAWSEGVTSSALMLLNAPGDAQDMGCRMSGGDAPLKFSWGMWPKIRVLDLKGQNVFSRGGKGMY